MSLFELVTIVKRATAARSLTWFKHMTSTMKYREPWNIENDNTKTTIDIYPRCPMYGIFPNIYPKNHPNVGKYTIHGAYIYMIVYGFGTTWEENAPLKFSSELLIFQGQFLSSQPCTVGNTPKDHSRPKKKWHKYQSFINPILSSSMLNQSIIMSMSSVNESMFYAYRNLHSSISYFYDRNPVTIWLFNSSPWKITSFKNGKPSTKIGHGFHGYVSHNQMVICSISYHSQT